MLGEGGGRRKSQCACSVLLKKIFPKNTISELQQMVGKLLEKASSTFRLAAALVVLCGCNFYWTAHY